MKSIPQRAITGVRILSFTRSNDTKLFLSETIFLAKSAPKRDSISFRLSLSLPSLLFRNRGNHAGTVRGRLNTCPSNLTRIAFASSSRSEEHTSELQSRDHLV